MTADARGWRIALVPDALINPRDCAGAGPSDTLRVLEANGYGALQLPPSGKHAALLAVIADQVAEYTHHGYAVVAIGTDAEPGSGLHWRRLAPLLRLRGVAPLPRHLIRSALDAVGEAERLALFLSGYDIPVEQQRRWRA